jgi:glycosyltransferase involved in cell wall biosynthesis
MSVGGGFVAYTCHDAFPSSDINTHQIVRTLLEVTRLGVEVELTVPALSFAPGRSEDPRLRLVEYYGAAGEPLPEHFRVQAIDRAAPAGQLARGWFDARLPWRLRRRRPSLVWTRDPLAAAAAAWAGMPTLFETFRSDFATRPLLAPWRAALLSSRHLRGVIVHSRAAAAAFGRAGVAPEQCLVAYNGFAPRLMRPVLARDEARQRLGLAPQAKLVVYAGHVGADKALDALLRMAAAVPEAHVLILGADPHSGDGRRLAIAAREAGVGSRVLLRPHVPAADVAPYLYAADCLAIPPYADGSERHRCRMLPIKVFSYMAAGRAILAPRLPDIQEVLTDGETALLYEPGTDAAGAAGLAALLGDPALRDRLGAAAHAVSVQFTWEARARRLVPFLTAALAVQRRSAAAAAAISRP